MYKSRRMEEALKTSRWPHIMWKRALTRTRAHARRTLARVSACSCDAQWGHRGSSLFMSLLFHTRTSETEKGSAPQALWFLSYLKRLFLIPPTRSATADDARPWTLISSPYIHQTGKITFHPSLAVGVTVTGSWCWVAGNLYAQASAGIKTFCLF